MTADGKPDRRWVCGKTQDEVREKMEALKTARNEGLVPQADGLSVGEFLARWLEHKRPEVKPKTFAGYERLALEAAVHGGRDRVVRAMLAHPLVGQYDRAEKLTDLLIANNKEHLTWAR